jgi:ABC-2 type transport system permease protein
MNSQSNTMVGELESPGITHAIVSAARPLYWSVRRELWESRSIYIAPLVAAALFLLGFMINLAGLRHHPHGRWMLDRAPDVFAGRYEFAAALIMGTELIVGVFYTLDALYGERRDRSILFWKSLPVSDRTAVLSKFTVPIVILPLLSFVITIATQFVMLVMGTAMLPGSGVNLVALWTHASFFHVSLVLLYHLVTVHGLWYAPLYGWLLLVGAWAPRAPFIWAFLPPFVICGLEKIAFNSSYCLSLLENRLTGPQSAAPMQASGHMDFMASLIPHNFFTEPGLWIGLAIAAAFVFAAIRLRRYRGPI